VSEIAAMDGFVMRRSVAHDHQVMQSPLHLLASHTQIRGSVRKGLVDAGDPQRGQIPRGHQVAPEPERQLGDDLDGRLDGYSDLRRFLMEDAFRAGVEEYGRQRYGEDHKHLLWQTLLETDYSMMPLVVLEPTAGRTALEVDDAAFHQPVYGNYVIQESPDPEDLL
jgi:hypothetical protein